MKKKLLTVLLIVVIVFNFIGTSVVYAEPDDTGTGIPKQNGEGQISQEQAENVMDGGQTSNGEISIGDAILGFIFQVIALMLNSFPMTIQGFMTALAANPTDGPVDVIEFIEDIANVDRFFTVEKAVFNEVGLFNINVFNLESSYKVGGDSGETINLPEFSVSLKESTAGWFYTCRLLAMMINLCILLYIGIRMAFSTVADEEARYKKMLISWAESMVVLFLLHYIMSFAISLGEIVLNIIYEIREGMTVESFEIIILKKIYNAIAEQSGMQIFMYSVFFWCITLIQAKFFVTYFKRVLSVMFLTIISPFITVTYPIDKIGDNKAQAFEKWMKEYIVNVAIQPIHAAAYLIFVFTAGAIAEQAPFVAMIFLLSLGKVENIVKNIFGITDVASVKNFDEEIRGKKGKKGKK